MSRAGSLALLSTRAQDHEGHLVVERRLTHQQIADRIGATRETVCRAMKELYGSGCLCVWQTDGSMWWLAPAIRLARGPPLA